MCHPISQRKIEANRRNALRSTGPRTAAGKARSSRNATTHGIFCGDMVLSDEDPRQFENYRIHMLRRLEPRDGVEQELAEQILSIGWRLKRVRRAENEMFEDLMRPSDDAPEGRSSARALAKSLGEKDSPMERLARYERRLQSTMNQLIGRLLQLQKVRQHGILDDHAAKLMTFQEPENIGEQVKAKIEPNEDGSDPREGIYGRWEGDHVDEIEPVVPTTSAAQRLGLIAHPRTRVAEAALAVPCCDRALGVAGESH